MTIMSTRAVAQGATSPPVAPKAGKKIAACPTMVRDSTTLPPVRPSEAKAKPKDAVLDIVMKSVLAGAPVGAMMGLAGAIMFAAENALLWMIPGMIVVPVAAVAFKLWQQGVEKPTGKAVAHIAVKVGGAVAATACMWTVAKALILGPSIQEIVFGVLVLFGAPVVGYVLPDGIAHVVKQLRDNEVRRWPHLVVDWMNT